MPTDPDSQAPDRWARLPEPVRWADTSTGQPVTAAPPAAGGGSGTVDGGVAGNVEDGD